MVFRIAGLCAAIAIALLIAAAGAGVPLQAQQAKEGSTDQGSAPGNKNSKIVFTQLRTDINQPNCGLEGDYPGYACDAATADERQNSEIWIMNDADGTELRQLTHNNTFDLGAVLSPDGNTIAFYGTKFKEPYLKGDVDTGPQIFVIPADSTDGSEQQALTPAIGDLNGDQNVTAADCAFADPSKPCGAAWPSWAPEGDKIAFQDFRNWIWVMDVADKDGDGKLESSNLTKLSDRALRPHWNSKGNQIVFQSGRDGNPDIWVMDVADTNGDGKLESSNPINLTTASRFSEQVPDLSPDDSKIVFHGDRDQRDPTTGKPLTVQIGGESSENLNELYVMDLARDPSGNITGPADPANLTRLTKCTWNAVTETCTETAGSPRNLGPKWSPNGKEIAFHKHVTLNDPLYKIRLTDSVLQTFVMDAKDDNEDGEGDNLRQLTQLPSENGHAGWGTS